MYSRDETVKAITAFYQHLIKHPYLPDNALMIPNFDKQGCKVALVKLEQEFWEESSRLSDSNDPDGAFFD